MRMRMKMMQQATKMEFNVRITGNIKLANQLRHLSEYDIYAVLQHQALVEKKTLDMIEGKNVLITGFHPMYSILLRTAGSCQHFCHTSWKYALHKIVVARHSSLMCINRLEFSPTISNAVDACASELAIHDLGDGLKGILWERSI